MKKLLVLVAVLALVAAMIVPMAASATAGGSAGSAQLSGGVTVATGSIVAPTVSVVAPSGNIAFGSFVPGWNPTPTTFVWSLSGTWGSVTLTDNSDPAASYVVTAQGYVGGGLDFSNGHMWSPSLGRDLDNPMQVAFGTATGSPAVIGAPGYLPAVTMTGNTPGTTLFTLGAAQNVTTADAQAGAAGDYYFYIQLSAQAQY
jgi:hypothetical protein